MPRGVYKRKAKADPSVADDKWRQGVAARKGAPSAYDRAKAAPIADSINCETIRSALDFLAEATQDEIFKAAALALDGYGMKTGGLKRKMLQILADAHLKTEWQVMPLVHQLVENGESVKGAARSAASTLSLAGASLDSIVDDIRKLYPAWLKNEGCSADDLTPPDGSTGRKLKVKITTANPTEAERRGRSEPLPDGACDAGDGFLLVPDDRHWRRWVASGYAALFGVVKS